MAPSKNLTPGQRVLRARMAAHALHSQGKTNMQPALRALEAKYAAQVDPDGILPEAERQRRAAHARSAHMAKLAYLSAKARSKGTPQ